MSALRNPFGKLRGKDVHDILTYAQVQLARLKMALWYSLLFGSTGRGAWMKRPSQIVGARNIHLGDGVRIEPGVVLYSVRKMGATTYGRRHPHRRAHLPEPALQPDGGLCHPPRLRRRVRPQRVRQRLRPRLPREPGVGRMQTALVSKGAVVIGDRCWIGANACIASGVELGHDCVVGANSVVTRSFPPCTVVAGAPAVAIRRLDAASGQWVPVARPGAAAAAPSDTIR